MRLFRALNIRIEIDIPPSRCSSLRLVKQSMGEWRPRQSVISTDCCRYKRKSRRLFTDSRFCFVGRSCGLAVKRNLVPESGLKFCFGQRLFFKVTRSFNRSWVFSISFPSFPFSISFPSFLSFASFSHCRFRFRTRRTIASYCCCCYR